MINKYILIIALLFISPIQASTLYDAELVRILDGDTIEVKVILWLGLSQIAKVRILGIDTPEKRGSPKCEKLLAKQATDYLRAYLKGKKIMINDVKYGKFAGRVLANVYADGASVSTAMLDSGFAIEYFGGKRDYVWCK